MDSLQLSGRPVLKQQKTKPDRFLKEVFKRRIKADRIWWDEKDIQKKRLLWEAGESTVAQQSMRRKKKASTAI